MRKRHPGNQTKKPFPGRGLAPLPAFLALATALMCQSLMLAPAAPEPSAVRSVDADILRVGISDDAMTALEYPQAQVSSTGPFTVRDKTTGLTLVNAKAGEVVTVTVDRLGFYLKGNSLTTNLPMTAKALLSAPLSATSGSSGPPLPGASDLTLLKVKPVEVVNQFLRVPGPLEVTSVNPASRLKIVNITRRKEIPEFRGTFEIVRGASSPARLTVVNVVDLEDYLKAVVPNELPMRYGLEAVRAQAVAARNYAIRPREKPWKTFDICDSQLCQVYLGAQTETPDSNRAIADTEGLVALYDGTPILALFSSAHGGYSESYSNAFSDPVTKQYPAPPIPYLRGGPDVPLKNGLLDIDLRTEAGARKFWTDSTVESFDVESPYYRWTRQWTRSELEAAINQGLAEVSKTGGTKDFVSPKFKPTDKIGILKAVNVKERGISGKVMILEIVGSHGKWTVEKEFLVRKLFTKTGRMLPSGNVVFTPLKDAQGRLVGMRANGGGFGHGVGLSQLGASWMHKHGYRFPQIIQHYYRGSSLGSRPVQVGPGYPDMPVLTHFEVARARGMLWLQEGDSSQSGADNAQPVKLRVNDRELTVSPSGYRSGMSVDTLLRPGERNTLMLYPDSQHPDRKLKAWIELFPPKEPSLDSQISLKD